MAVGRQLNVKGQMRLDVPHIRMIESGVTYDFDTLAGGILAGKSPYVVTGFTLSYITGMPAATISVVTAGGIIVDYLATENGSMLMVPDDRPAEVLSVANYRVIGNFVANADNYISIDFIRSEDNDTADIVQFIDPSTGQNIPKTIPLGRTLDYRIYIASNQFSSVPNRCPIAIISTDASNRVTSVTDARPMMFRLAAGGDDPNPYNPFTWPEGRTETSGSFAGGDKGITNLKEWASAVMQRVWELSGGEYWYSDATDRNQKFFADPTDEHDRVDLTNNQIWDGTDITWSGLGVAFSNSTATVNEIKDQTAVSSLTTLAEGECLYVDLDLTLDHRRTTNNALEMTKAVLTNLNASPADKPGSRVIIFWRPLGSSNVYSRLDYMAVGRYSQSADIGTYGVTKIASPNVPSGGPFAIISDAAWSSGTSTVGNAIASGITRKGTSAGKLTVGSDAYDTSIQIGHDSGPYLTFVGHNVTLGGTGSTLALTGDFSATDVLVSGYFQGAQLTRNALSAGDLKIGGSTTDTTVTLMGAQTAGSANADVIADTKNTRTAGKLFSFRNNGTEEAFIAYNGRASLAGVDTGSISSAATLGITGNDLTLTGTTSATLTGGTIGISGTTLNVTSGTINIASAAESNITIGKTSASTQATKIYGKTINIADTNAAATLTIGNTNSGTKTYVYGNEVILGSLLGTYLTGTLSVTYPVAVIHGESAGTIFIGAAAANSITTTIGAANSTGTVVVHGADVQINSSLSSAIGVTHIGNTTGATSILGNTITLGDSVRRPVLNSTTSTSDSALTVATKGYVDNAVAGVPTIRMVRVDSTGNIISRSHPAITVTFTAGTSTLDSYFTVNWGFTPTYITVTCDGTRSGTGSEVGSVTGYSNEASYSLSGYNSIIRSFSTVNFWREIPGPVLEPGWTVSTLVGFTAIAF